MRREYAILINHSEVLELGEVDRVNMDHKRDERSFTGTGILPIFRGFYKEVDGKTENIDKSVVEQKIIDLLIEKGEIQPKGFRVEWRPNHRFSDFDDEGYAHSIYTIEMKVYQSNYVSTKELVNS